VIEVAATDRIKESEQVRFAARNRKVTDWPGMARILQGRGQNLQAQVAASPTDSHRSMEGSCVQYWSMPPIPCLLAALPAVPRVLPARTWVAMEAMERTSFCPAAFHYRRPLPPPLHENAPQTLRHTAQCVQVAVAAPVYLEISTAASVSTAQHSLRVANHPIPPQSLRRPPIHHRWELQAPSGVSRSRKFLQP
jgi:hypothetical protein